MYFMFSVCVLVTIVGAIAQFGASLKDNPKGAIKSLGGVLLFVAVLVVAWIIASDAPLMMDLPCERTVLMSFDCAMAGICTVSCMRIAVPSAVAVLRILFICVLLS